MLETIGGNPWVQALALLLSGVVIGLISEKLILRRILSVVQRIEWKVGRALADSLHWLVLIWFMLAGAYAAVLTVPISDVILHRSNRILTILTILSVTWFLMRLVTRLVDNYTRTVDADTSIFRSVAALAIFFVGLLVVFNELGVSITPMLTAMGVGGLAVALALQGTLANLFSGIQILAAKQIRPGDYIQLSSGEEGYVSDINWRNTTIRALANNMTIIPNSKFADTVFINYHQPVKVLRVFFNVGVHYDSDLEQVERVVLEVARETQKEAPGGVRDHEPWVRFHTFNDFSIDFRVILMATEYEKTFSLKHDFVKRLHRRFNEEGIVIPYPLRTLHLDPTTTEYVDRVRNADQTKD